jgi:hypothetical protein
MDTVSTTQLGGRARRKSARLATWRCALLAQKGPRVKTLTEAEVADFRAHELLLG